MRIDLVIAVWGDWHINALANATLPSCLSPGNIPRLGSTYDGRLRVFTRRRDAERLRQLPGISALASLIPTEVIAATEADAVPAPVHLEWWHRAATEAASRDSMVLNLPPDVIFPDGCLANFCAALEKGKKVVLAPPQLRTVSETTLDEVSRKHLRDGVVSLTPRETVDLGMRHLHPLFAEVLPGCPFGRPGIEFLWPVGDEGFLLCQTTREIIAFDPMHRRITDRFLESATSDFAQVHVSASSDDTFFLSLAPLLKDFGLVLPGFPTTAKFLARWSTHPDNDIPLADLLPHQLVRLEARQATPERWVKVEHEAREWLAAYAGWREVYRVWREGRAGGCGRAGEIIGLAAHVLDLPRLFRCSGKATVFLPSDTALAAVPPARMRQWLGTGNEDALRRFILDHVVGEEIPLPRPGSNREVVALSGKRLLLEQNADGGLAVEGASTKELFAIGRITVYAIEAVLGGT